MRYDSGSGLLCSTGACPSYDTLNANYHPVLLGGSCSLPAFLAGGGSSTVTVTPGHSSLSGSYSAGSKLQVKALPTATETIPATFNAVTGGDGSAILGREISQVKTTSGGDVSTLHALMPIVDPSGIGTGAATLSEVSRTGGQEVRMHVSPEIGSTYDYDVETYWLNPGSSEVKDSSSFWVSRARVGVLVHDDGQSTTLYAASMLKGSEMVYRGATILHATDPSTSQDKAIDASVTYGNNAAFGEITTDGDVDLLVHVPSSAVYGGVASLVWSSPSGFTSTYTFDGALRNAHIAMRGTGKGYARYRITFSSPSTSAVVSSTCHP